MLCCARIDSMEVGSMEFCAIRSMNRPVRRMVSKQRREAIQDMMESFDTMAEEVRPPASSALRSSDLPGSPALSNARACGLRDSTPPF